MTDKEDAIVCEGAMAVVGDAPLVKAVEPSIGEIIKLAVEKGRPGDEMEKLVGLYERMQDRKAAIEFTNALAGFQRDCPLVERRRTAQVAKRGGGGFSYTFADLSDIVVAVREAAHKYGLSYSWDSEDDGGMIQVTCWLAHIGGHTRPAKVSMPIAGDIGSAQQQKASAMTFARRQSLVAAFGLTMCDSDFDGVNPPEPFSPMTDEQLKTLRDLFKSRQPDCVRFCKWAGITIPDDLADRVDQLPEAMPELLAELPASRFAEAKVFLERKAVQG